MALSAAKPVGLARVLALAAAWSCARPEPTPAPLSATAPHAPSPARDEAPTPQSDAARPDPPPPPAPTPLEREGELAALDVEGFLPAVVSVPKGRRLAHPVAVAFHGNFDRPEWQCEVFRPVIGDYGFLLCPRGIARRDVPKSMDRWEYASGAQMARELEAALGALTARYGVRVDPGPVVFIGFSLGAIYGAPIVQKSPARFPRSVMVEGGHGAWTAAIAKRYAEAGGLRLFLACGQAPCVGKAARLAVALTRAGLPTQSGGSKTAGHTYDGDVAAAVHAAWPWLTEGDPRWGP
jgi:predicted esterase